MLYRVICIIISRGQLNLRTRTMTLASILTTFCRRRAAFPAASPISSTSSSSSTPSPGLVLRTPSRQLSFAFKKTKNDNGLIRDKHTFSSDSSSRGSLPVSACLGNAVLAAQTEEKEDPVSTEDEALVLEVTDDDGAISGAGSVLRVAATTLSCLNLGIFRR